MTEYKQLDNKKAGKRVDNRGNILMWMGAGSSGLLGYKSAESFASGNDVSGVMHGLLALSFLALSIHGYCKGRYLSDLRAQEAKAQGGLEKKLE